jgi:CMP/dCMP kinase
MTDGASVPVITIDGPSGSGKGTVTHRVAAGLGWHTLDSGALYRLLALAAVKRGIDLENENLISRLSAELNVEFNEGVVLLDEEDVTNAIRSEAAGNNASRVAAIPGVRDALLSWQREFARPPGLVADGRDMGTTVFPGAQLKIFLDASACERAERRHKQLIEKGLPANLANLKAEIEERDVRDRCRAVSPLVPAPDAIVIDSTELTIEAVVEQVMEAARSTFG